MHAMDEQEEIRSTAEADAAIESAVLQQVLELHPTSLTLGELVREMGEDRRGAAAREAIERAVDDLAAAGLLHHSDAFVRPTRAALRFEQLLEA
jgi:hypothetical protein